MCDPITIAGIALTGASYAANSIASKQAASARDDVLVAERARQKQYDQEATQLNDQSRDRFADFEGQQSGVAAKLGDFIGSQTATPGGSGGAEASAPLPASQSTVTVQNDQKEQAQAKQFTNTQGQALGELRSFGDLLGTISRFQGRDAAQLAQIGGFKRGSSSIVPYELEDASKKGAGLRMFGDILGAVGSLGVSAGLQGGFGGASAAAGAGAARAVDPWAGARTASRASTMYGVR